MSDTVKVIPSSSYKADLAGSSRRKAVEAGIELIYAHALAGRANLEYDLSKLGAYADSIEAALEKKT